MMFPFALHKPDLRVLILLLVAITMLALAQAQAQALRFVENRSDVWAPLPAPDPIAKPMPAFGSMFTAAGDFIRPETPTALTDSDNAAGIFPTVEMMRPHTRIYWVDQEGPLAIVPPPADDPRWTAVDAFLLGDPRTRPADAAIDGFLSRVWKDETSTEETPDKDSIGAWSNHFTRDWYPWVGPQFQKAPEYLRVGALPWSDGSDSNGHYDIAVWCLEEYRRTGDTDAWRMFVKIVLHQAGIGLNWQTGSWRYEKAKWVWTGDFYPAATVQWSHTFPAGVLLFWHLTGCLSDAANLIFLHTVQSATTTQALYNGWYGPRRCAWYLRTLRCSDGVLGDAAIGQADRTARHVIDAVLEHTRAAEDGSGRFLVELQGQPTWGNLTVPFLSGTWAVWTFLGEATWWAAKWGDQERLTKLAELGNWLRVHTVSPAGQVAYTARVGPAGDASEQSYTSATHTATALMAMSALTSLKRYPREDFARSFEFLASRLPHGILGGVTPGDGRDRGMGPAAPKICADLSLGLRTWIVLDARR